MPLVINVDSADIMATLILLKSEVETSIGETLKFTFVGGSESHLLASEISGAGIGVILIPSRPFPVTWEGRLLYAQSVLLCYSAYCLPLACLAPHFRLTRL